MQGRKASAVSGDVGAEYSACIEGVDSDAVFFLTGLWHGANWTFIVWGLLYHGSFLLFENLEKAVRYIGCMFGIGSDGISNLNMVRELNLQYAAVMLISIVVATKTGKMVSEHIRRDWIKDAGTLVVFFIAICYMIASDYNLFIYLSF